MHVGAGAEVLRQALPYVPKVAIVLGSGLGELEHALRERVVVPFSIVPGLPGVGVAGHGGRFVAGRLGSATVLLQAGRIHAYEGHSMDVVCAPVRMLASLGVEIVVLTNAVGGIHPRIEPGDMVVIDDQINLTFAAPLSGPALGSESRFLDMREPFDPSVRAALYRVASDLGIELKEGTYGGVIGPAYETAAEVEMLARLGANVVGMSAVPEVIAAIGSGLRCAVLSLVTNKATGLSLGPISHEEVLALGRDARERMGRLLTGVVESLAQSVGAK